MPGILDQLAQLQGMGATQPTRPPLQIDPNANTFHAQGPGGILGSRPPYEATGAELGSLYHGGVTKLQSVDTSKLQSRDYGFYGAGLYGTAKPEYAKNYGPRVTQFSLDPEARVLNASLNPQEAPQGLFDAVRQHVAAGYPAAFMRGKSDQMLDELSSIGDSPINWKNAVDSFATKNGYDAVRYSDGEIVIKNPQSVRLK